MATRFTRQVRPLIVLLAVSASIAIAPTFAAATPHTQPSITDVQKQLGQLALKNTQLVEAYDQAVGAVASRQKAATVAAGAAVRARTQYDAAHAQFVQIIQAQYEGQSLGGAAGALLDSNSGSNYLDRLDALDMITSHTADVVKEVAQLRNQAQTASSTAATMLGKARRQRDLLARQRSTVAKQIAKYRTLLATLTSAQRAAYQRAANPAVSTKQVSKLHKQVAATHLTAAGSGAAKIAVQFALNQVGKPYSWGTAGPRTYDCSGLTMSAWRAAGVRLPHSAAGQYGYGHHVSRSELQPGDLIFFYHPIGHVTIYIGDGMMVSAPTEGQNVSVVPLSAFNSSYTGATRLT